MRICLYFHGILQISSGKTALTFPAMTILESFETILLPVFFGGTVLKPGIASQDGLREVESVPCLQMVYFVAVDTKRQIER